MRRGRPPTPFERRVYAVVRRIPRGEVRTYLWVAEQLGDPKLARAVGNALNRNPFAPRIPCHRVIRSDGRLGGYARGIARKRRLLQLESARHLSRARRSRVEGLRFEHAHHRDTEFRGDTERP